MVCLGNCKLSAGDTACSPNHTPSVTGKTHCWMQLHSHQQFQSPVLTNNSKRNSTSLLYIPWHNQVFDVSMKTPSFCPKIGKTLRQNQAVSFSESLPGLSAHYKTRPKWKETGLFLSKSIWDAPQCINQGLYQKVKSTVLHLSDK